MSKRVIAYTRVSTEDQARKGLSLEAQEKQINDYATSRGYVVVKLFREEGESAKTTQRTQLANLTQYVVAHKGEVDGILVYKLDRFSRNAGDYHQLVGMFKAYGVEIISVTEPVENNPTGRFLGGLFALVAQLDNDVRAERTSGGMAMMLEKGGWPFKAPLGYKNVRSGDRAAVVKNEAAELVKEWLLTYLTGSWSLREMQAIALDIGLNGAKGKPLSYQMVKKMLSNPFYAGLVSSSLIGEVTVGQHEPLIAIAEHHRILSKLNGNEHPERINRLRADDWVLNGFVRCADCGGRLIGNAPRGRSKRYPRYSCMSCRTSVTGKSTSVNREKLHTEFQALLSSITPTESVLADFRTVVMRQWHGELKVVRNRRRALQSQIEQLEARRERVMQLLIDGAISASEKSQQFDSIDQQKADLVVQLSQDAALEALTDEQLQYATAFICNLPKLWRDAPPSLRTQMLNLVFPEGLVYELGIGFRTATLGPAYTTFELIKAKRNQTEQSKNHHQASDDILVAPRGLEPLLPP